MHDNTLSHKKLSSEIDGDIVWSLDMIGELGVFPHNLATSSPAYDEELIYVCTSNGVDEGHIVLPDPFAPSFLAVDKETGRLLLSERDSLFLSPDGHGGMLAAFHGSGCLADARRRGIEHLFFGQIDNPLLQVCDESLIGYHILAGSEMTSQVVQKQHPLDRVGNVVEIDGQTLVIEYSDLPNEVARQRNPDGSLILWAGSIAVHNHVSSRPLPDFAIRITIDDGPFCRFAQEICPIDSNIAKSLRMCPSDGRISGTVICVFVSSDDKLTLLRDLDNSILENNLTFSSCDVACKNAGI